MNANIIGGLPIEGERVVIGIGTSFYYAELKKKQSSKTNKGLRIYVDVIFLFVCHDVS